MGQLPLFGVDFKVFFGNSFGGFTASQPLGEPGSAVVPALEREVRVKRPI